MLLTESRLRKIIEEELKIVMQEVGKKRPKLPGYLKRLADEDEDEDGGYRKYNNDPDDGGSGAEGGYSTPTPRAQRPGTRVKGRDDTEN